MTLSCTVRVLSRLFPFSGLVKMCVEGGGGGGGGGGRGENEIMVIRESS